MHAVDSAEAAIRNYRDHNGSSCWEEWSRKKKRRPATPRIKTRVPDEVPGADQRTTDNDRRVARIQEIKNEEEKE